MFTSIATFIQAVVYVLAIIAAFIFAVLLFIQVNVEFFEDLNKDFRISARIRLIKNKVSKII